MSNIELMQMIIMISTYCGKADEYNAQRCFREIITCAQKAKPNLQDLRAINCIIDHNNKKDIK